MTGDDAERPTQETGRGIAIYWNGEQIWIPATPLHFSTGTCLCLRQVRDSKGKAEYATRNHGGRLRLVEAVAGWSKIRRPRKQGPRSTKCRPHLICARRRRGSRGKEVRLSTAGRKANSIWLTGHHFMPRKQLDLQGAARSVILQMCPEWPRHFGASVGQLRPA
jgi:hypothetical protein